MPSYLFANLQTMSLFVLPSSPLLSSDHQNIIVTIIIVLFCSHHHFIMSSLMDTDVLDLLVQDEDLEELLLSSSCPFVFHSGMNCPVISCGFGSFNTRKSYSRPNINPIILYFTVQFLDASQPAKERPTCGTTSDQSTI